jgi:hypothetical protein
MFTGIVNLIDISNYELMKAIELSLIVELKSSLKRVYINSEITSP